jgi:type VI secretion system protein ImpI
LKAAQGSFLVLELRIENETTLPDGGPLSIAVEGTRGIDIGRDQYLDWTLPDPSRFISGKHCEVRWHDDAYWLHDVSTNGTFLDGADGRLKAPHKLRSGDRFSIGHYIIVTAISGAVEPAASVSVSQAPPDYDNLWEPVGDVAPPIDPKQLKAARDLQPVKPDFLDWAVDLPLSHPSADRSALPARESMQWDTTPAAIDDASWAQGQPKAVPSEPVPPVAAVPNPRRPVWITGEPDGPWAAPATSASVRPATQNNADTRDTAPINAASDDNTAEFVRQIARAAGMPADALAARDPATLADDLGQMIRLVTENMRQLLEARQQAKRFARSSNQTTIQALDNNPLKFAPTAEDAMRIMFGPPTKSYLDARSAVAQGFDDLKTHQLKTFSAMQHALKQLMEELAPATIEKDAATGRGLAGTFGSRKARYWDAYAGRWQLRTRYDEDGMLHAFMDYFAEHYDQDGNGG